MVVSEVELARRRTMMGTSALDWVSSPTMFGSVGPQSWSLLSGSSAPDMNMVLIHAADPGLLAKPLAQIAQRACPSLLMFARRRQGHLCSTPREVAGLVAAPLHAEHPGPMSIWLLEVDIEAVSTVTTCRVQDTVSVWCMATPTRHARRGYGKALLASVQESAHQDGAVLGLLGATPAGLPLYDATGWQTQETWDLYTGAASAQFSA